VTSKIDWLGGIEVGVVDPERTFYWWSGPLHTLEGNTITYTQDDIDNGNVIVVQQTFDVGEWNTVPYKTVGTVDLYDAEFIHEVEFKVNGWGSQDASYGPNYNEVPVGIQYIEHPLSRNGSGVAWNESASFSISLQDSPKNVKITHCIYNTRTKKWTKKIFNIKLKKE
jgi:hypothetical protein